MVSMAESINIMTRNENMSEFNCRLCLSEIINEATKIPLYLKCENDLLKKIDQELTSMIAFCVSVEISDITLYPAHICCTCFEFLKQCDDFKKKCQASDSELKKCTATTINNGPTLCEETKTIEIKEEVTVDRETNKDFEVQNETVPTIKVVDFTKLMHNGKHEEKSLEESKKYDDTDFDDEKPLSEVLLEFKKNSKETKKRKYLCSYCGETFRRQVAKEVHEKEHQQLYKCVLCFESFYSHTKLQKHRAEVHNEDPYCCSFCSTGFSDVHTWTNHLKLNHFCCSKCRSYFKTKEDQLNHMCLKKSVTTPGCSGEDSLNYIQYDFPDQKKIIPLKRKVGPKKNYYQLKKLRLAAEKEGTSSLNFVKMPIIENLIEEDKRVRLNCFPCNRCDRNFVDKGSLICHQAVVHPGEPIDNTHRPPKKSVLFCKICLCFFRQPIDLNMHDCKPYVGPLRKFKYPWLPQPGQFMTDAPSEAEAFAASSDLEEAEEIDVKPDITALHLRPLPHEERDHSPTTKNMSPKPYLSPNHSSTPPETPPPFAEALLCIPEIKQEVVDCEECNADEGSQSPKATEPNLEVNPNILANLGLRQDLSL